MGVYNARLGPTYNAGDATYHYTGTIEVHVPHIRLVTPGQTFTTDLVIDHPDFELQQEAAPTKGK